MTTSRMTRAEERRATTTRAAAPERTAWEARAAADGARILELDNCKGTEAVSLFWVDYEGRPQEWGRVEAGEVMLYHTWAGHAWEARGTARRRRYVLPLGGADVELSAEVGVDCFE